MTSPWLDDDFEDESHDDIYDDIYDDENYDDGNDYEDTSKKDALARAQRRQREVALAVARRKALRRALASRGRPLAPTVRPTTPRQAVSAIRKLDLDGKVREDSLRKTIADQRERASRANYATVASVAVQQLLDSFPNLDNPFAKAGLRFAPILLLSPEKKGSGAGALMRDPRVIGGAAIAGILAFGETQNIFKRATSFSVVAPSSGLIGAANVKVRAISASNSGAIVDVPGVKWEAMTPDIAKVDENGHLTLVAAGEATFVATDDNGRVQVFRVNVT